MFVSTDCVQTPPRSGRNETSEIRFNEIVSSCGVSTKITDRIPLSSSMISKRIVSPKSNSRRRVIFPFLPKTEDETIPETAPAVTCNRSYKRPIFLKKNSDPAQESPRVVWDTFTLDSTQETTMPFLPTSRSVEPILLPRESTLSSQDDPQPCPENISVSFRTDDSFLQDDASDTCAKNSKESTDAPQSILRPSKSWSARSSDSVEKISSIESDLPSLASSSQSESCEEMQRKIFPLHVPKHHVRAKSLQSSTSSISSSNKLIAFDARVWVREFERSPEEHRTTWYSRQELENFKVAAIERILAFSETELVPTGTGRMVPKQKLVLGKAFFSHRALGTENEVKKESLFRAVLQNEMRRVLIVDSHDIFLQLFAKTLRPLLPHAEIVLAHTAAAALAMAEQGRFDLIIVEERLKSLPANSTTSPKKIFTFGPSPSEQEWRSGSALMQRLQLKYPRSLYIGVSAKMREDQSIMTDVADVCWGKPPPHMNAHVVRDLLHKLLIKRQRFQAINEIYSSTC